MPTAPLSAAGRSSASAHSRKPGDSFRYENLTVTVLAMDGRRVERVLVQPDPASDKDE